MPDYKNGQIYMIWSPNTDLVYIGSTTQPLYKRFYEHCHSLDTSSYKVIECGNAKIELIEDYPCVNKKELNRREGQVIRERKLCVNNIVAGRTKKEYRYENKEAIAAHSKAYRQENKEAIDARTKAYQQENKEAIAAHSKAYRQKPEVREHRNEQQRQYRQAYNQKPEVKEHRNEQQRQYRQRKKQEEQEQNPAI